MTLNKLTYAEKTNPKPIVDRSKQATAEDFNEIKEVVNPLVDAVKGIDEGSNRRSFANVAAATTFWNNANPKPDNDIMINIEDVNKTYKWASGQASKVLFVKDNIDGASVVAAQAAADNAQGTANNAMQNAALAQQSADSAQKEAEDNGQDIAGINQIIGDREDISDSWGDIGSMAGQTKQDQEIISEGSAAFSFRKRLGSNNLPIVYDLFELDEIIRERRSRASVLLTPHGSSVSSLRACIPTNGDADFAFFRSSVQYEIGQDGSYKRYEVNVPAISWETGKPLFMNRTSSQNKNIDSEFSNTANYTDAIGGYSSIRTVIDSHVHDGKLMDIQMTGILGGGIRRRITGLVNGPVHFVSFYIESEEISVFRVLQENSPAYNQNSARNVDINISDFTYSNKSGFGEVEFKKLGRGVLVIIDWGVADSSVSTASINFEIRGLEAANNGKNILFGLLMVEEYKYTSYIPTSGTLASRAATSYSTSSEISQYFKRNFAIVFSLVRFGKSYDASGGLFQIRSSSNVLLFRIYSTLNNTGLVLFRSENPIEQVSANLSDSILERKIAISVTNGVIKCFVNGQAIASNFIQVLADVGRMSLSGTTISSGSGIGVSSIEVLKGVQTEAKMIELTTV